MTYPANETPESVSATLTVSAQNISTAIEYTVKINQPAGGGEKVDLLTPGSLGISYGGSFEDVADNFAAAYTGNVRASGIYFDFPKKYMFEKFGIYSSKSGGKVKKIAVVWNDENQSWNGNAKLLIFCSNEQFTSVDEFHAKGLEPTGEVSYEGPTVFEVPGDYKYVALRSDSENNYIDKIEITWE